MVDLLLTPILHGLRECLCSALEAEGTPVCRCSGYPGAYAVADGCGCGKGEHGCGQAWVRLDRVYPTAKFPAQNSTPGCATILAAVIEVGVYRCRPTLDTRGRPPSAADLTASSAAEATDAMTIAKAITCCEPVIQRPHVLGVYLPRDSGDCGGGAWTVTVALTRAPST